MILYKTIVKKQVNLLALCYKPYKKDKTMKKLHTNKLLLLSCFILSATATVLANNPDKEEKQYGANPYTYAPQFFTAEDGVTGRLWFGNQEYPAKAYIEDVEYTDIIIIKKSQLDLKSKKKLRKKKDYLGFYINPQTNVAYNIYGVKKNPEPADDAPDSKVLTVIAIKNDYGIGE